MIASPSYKSTVPDIHQQKSEPQETKTTSLNLLYKRNDVEMVEGVATTLVVIPAAKEAVEVAGEVVVLHVVVEPGLLVAIVLVALAAAGVVAVVEEPLSVAHPMQLVIALESGEMIESIDPVCPETRWPRHW